MIDLKNSYRMIIWDIGSRLVNTDYFGKEEDSGRGLKVRILQGSAVITPTTETLRLYCQKPDATKVYIDGVLDGDHYNVKLTNQVYAVAGTVKVELQLNVGGEWVTSETFGIAVNPNLVDSSVVSSNDFITLRNALADVDEVKNTMTQKANTSTTDNLQNQIDLITTQSDNYYVKCLSTDTGALLVVASSATTGQINLASVTPHMSDYTPIAGDYVTKAYNTLNAETKNIRTAYDGTVYANAGESVREQIGKLSEEIINDYTNIGLFSNGGYTVTNGEINTLLTRFRTTDYIDNFIVKITCNTGYAMHLFAWDNSNNYIGSWLTGTGFNKTEATFMPKIDLITFYNDYPTYKFKIVVWKGGANCSIVDADNVIFKKSMVIEHTKEINDSKVNITALNSFDCANNDKSSAGSATSELNRTSIFNNSDKFYINYSKKDIRNKRSYHNKRIIAVNHDDLAGSDYVGVRKIYNKYGFNANFNFILRPFSNLADMELMTENVKRLIADGNDLGIHAIMNASFWWMNKMFDIRPNFTYTYVPTLLEQKTIVSDSKNIFGYTITGSSKLTDIGFANPATNFTVNTMADVDYITTIAQYCLYSMTATITGIDLDGRSQTWAGLRWLEYWYNELIDSTLGYSNGTGSIFSNFIADYEVPIGTAQSQSAYNTYYPDGSHLSNGKIVFFDDTLNVNYTNPEYQIVGRFKKGLFKGSALCCNYEVIDRCIDIVKAFCRHYFEFDNFTNLGRHGGHYVNCLWKDSDLVPYDNREKTIIAGEVGNFFQTRVGIFESEFDILLQKGIKMTNHVTPLSLIFESQVGLYYGQNNIRYPFFNYAEAQGGSIGYLLLFGTSSNAYFETMDYATFMDYMGTHDNWMKYAYENAGKTITNQDNTESMFMFDGVQKTINSIRACLGTGKIPVFSLDTIANNTGIMAAVELVCQYCYLNDIDIVPLEYARVMAINNTRDYETNYFPNPKFTQSVLNMFNGESISADAYIPDGWAKNYVGGDLSYDVLTETIDGKNQRIFTVNTTNSGFAYIQSKIYGLKPGTYKFSCYAKSDNIVSHIDVFAKKNSDYYNQYYTGSSCFEPVAGGSFHPTANYVLYSVEFIIPEPYHTAVDSNVASQYSNGYGNNVSNITVEIYVGRTDDTNDHYLSMYNPKIELIN